MCSRASGLFCACLLVSCVVHCGRCMGKQDSHNHTHSEHHHHHHSEDGSSTDEKTDFRFFVQELFNKYGQNGVLTFEEFEQMLESLGLKPMVLDVHDKLPLHHHHHSITLRRDAQSSSSNSDDINNVNASKKTDKQSSSSVSQAMKSVNVLSSNNVQSVVAEDAVGSGSGANSESGYWSLNLTSFSDHHHSENPIAPVFGNRCLTAAEILHSHNISPSEGIITQPEFFRICPAIIYQMDQNICSEEPADHHDMPHPEYSASTYYVWLYASLAVLVISMCGLFSVAVIPIIQRVCYHTLLQFLVGLAVGSLSGDAFLHLLPHVCFRREDGKHLQGIYLLLSRHASDAPQGYDCINAMVVGDDHNHHGDEPSKNHETVHIWRGLTALLGVYLFFLAERLLNLIASYRRMKQSAKAIQVPKFARALTRVDGEQSRVVGEKLSHHKHGSYGYKFDPAAVEALERLNETTLEDKEPATVSDKLAVPNNESQKDDLHINADISEAAVEDEEHEQISEWERNGSKHIEQNGDPSSPMKPLHVDVTYLPSDKHPEPETPTEECHRETVVYRHAHDDHSYVVTVTDHHHHGHSHEVPSTVSAVAWMVVMGDGLHNFCDGLAIGAAFGAGISGGLSTAIAVFCHELPHELGDFAMLLKAGMTVKQALLYNGLSSVLCFVGMLIGVSLGNIASATTWVFSGAAGMFLYIALVDMLPELGTISDHPSASGGQQLVIQLGGIALGTSIMLLIAVYEHDLQNLVS